MKVRRFKDSLATTFIRASLVFVNAIAFVIAITLFMKTRPILAKTTLSHLLSSTSWHPLRGDFGFFPFIIGTLEVTAIAMILSIPVCLLSAIYLSEYAHGRFRGFVRLVVDILAGIPSVIYGLCGVIAIVPLVRILGQALGSPTTGYSLLAGGIILAIMVSPVITSVALEVFRTIPRAARENSLALGITTWEMVKHVILRSSLHGIIAAIVLGFARAFGETMAVLMVVGNVPKVPLSLFDPAYPLPALIANNYGEMMSIPLYDSALMFAALILMVVVGGFSLGAHLILLKIERRGYV
ncbi:MAG TPA: phosphate ABC transporter permease subunit PstC [Deltaproteobacteria bacterium]|nr:phosphate ABC transporter permease subunit PstC [Deltaproteobacteria bacterium]